MTGDRKRLIAVCRSIFFCYTKWFRRLPHREFTYDLNRQKARKIVQTMADKMTEKYKNIYLAKNDVHQGLNAC